MTSPAADSELTLRANCFVVMAWTAVLGFGVAAVAMAMSAPFVHKPYGNTFGAAALFAVGSIVFAPRVAYEDCGHGGRRHG